MVFPRTRSRSHFRLTERSCQIFVFHSTNHLSDWEDICHIPVITIDACVRVRIASLPRIRFKSRGDGAERGDAPIPYLIQSPSSKIYLSLRGVKEWGTGERWVALISVHLFDLCSICLLRMLVVNSKIWPISIFR